MQLNNEDLTIMRKKASDNSWVKKPKRWLACHLQIYASFKKLVSLIVLSGDSLRRVNKAKISIHVQSLKSGTIEQVGVAFL